MISSSSITINEAYEKDYLLPKVYRRNWCILIMQEFLNPINYIYVFVISNPRHNLIMYCTAMVFCQGRDSKMLFFGIFLHCKLALYQTFVSVGLFCKKLDNTEKKIDIETC